jgi:hypothetical protein
MWTPTFRPSLLEDENDINETEVHYGSLDEKSIYDKINKYWHTCEHISRYSNSMFYYKEDIIDNECIVVTYNWQVLVLSYLIHTFEDKYTFTEDFICHLH